MSRTVTTNDAGSFRVDGLLPGVYTINVTKAGFAPVQSTVTVLNGSITNANVALVAASLSSIATIGRTAVSSGTAAFNTSTAAVARISGSDFVDQGQLNVNRVLNEVPGLIVSPGSIFSGPGAANNGASPISLGIPILRGSLPYETASLIDGHPINLGLYGTFNPAFINPYVLQDVEVVKGPGASATNINYAIGGTVNFRTLEPTAKPHESFNVGVDQFGGKNANLRATGTTPNGKFAYALDYATQGTNGFQAGWDTLNPLINLGPGSLINGQVVCGNPAATGCATGFVGTNTNTVSSGYYTTPLALCCTQTPIGSNSRNELGKLRYNFSPSTSLTVTYLGGQLRGGTQGANLAYLPQYYFLPPSNYSGSLAPGTNIPNYLQGDGGILATNANLFSVEARSAAGPVTLNARYYAAGVDTAYSYANFGPQDGYLYGAVPLGNSLTPTVFNGTPVSLIFASRLGEVYSKDKLGGFTFQASLPIGNDVFSVSYDTVSTKTSAATAYPTDPSADTTTVPAGSGQYFQTAALQAQFQLAPTLQATLSNYATLYTDHYTQDFGQTFEDSTHAYDAPRIAFSWRPSRNAAVRAAAGYSIAPPYISLLTNSAPTPNLLAGTSYFTQTANSGDIEPETSFGWDLGADHRLSHDATISVDVYQTLLRNQFLQATTLSPTPLVIPPGGEYEPGSFPLYITKTENLGHSEYQGVELTLHRDPAVGVGYKLQGALMRAYAYDLPPGLYATAAGPYTTNLGVLPNENFQTSGNGYNAISFTRVPYSQGYAEFNYRGRNGSYFLAGVTYFGPNNAYNEPAFGVVNASFSQPLSRQASLLFAVTNATSAYASFVPGFSGGVPTPLINGMLGPTPANVVGPSTASVTLNFNL